MTGLGKLLLAAMLGAMCLLAQESAAPQSAAPRQPMPFSHKRHASLGVKCLDCHAIRKPGFAAGLPHETTCMGCHSTVKKTSPAIKRLSEFNKTKTPVPWVKVYQVPDYVWFSHQVHYREAHIECQNCHGAVAARDVIAKEKPTSMTACVECHEKNKASTECGVCHDTH